MCTVLVPVSGEFAAFTIQVIITCVSGRCGTMIPRRIVGDRDSWSASVSTAWAILIPIT